MEGDDNNFRPWFEQVNGVIQETFEAGKLCVYSDSDGLKSSRGRM
jgi:hypothetical protein